MAPTSTGRRATLDRQQVVAAAVALADEQGLAALSMRRLGERLGVEAMSLYNHVDNKDDLLAGMVAVVVDRIDLPDPDADDWAATLRASAMSAHRQLVAHPWACHLIATRTNVVGATLFDWVEAQLATVDAAGFEGDLADHVYHALMGHVLGFTLQSVSLEIDDETAARAVQRVRGQLSEDDHPHMLAHLQFHADHDGEGGGASREFEFALDLLLAGLQRLGGG